jgi:serine/threonine protein kinase
MLRRMHDAGFSHRDLKAPNLLVAPSSGPGAAPDAPALGPVLVDLDGLRYGRRVPARRRARDLMRLSVSLDEWGVARRTDRLRFLRAYLGRRGCPRAIAVGGAPGPAAGAAGAPATCRAGSRRGRTGAARRLRRWWRRIARLSARKHAALARKNPG